MTVDPNDLLNLDLDDEDDEEEEEAAIHYAITAKKSSSADKKKKKNRRRSTIDPDDITALLNESTTSSKMEALTTASPFGSRRSSQASSRNSSMGSKGNTSDMSDISGQGEESFGVSGELPVVKNDRRATLDASVMDYLLDEEEGDDTAEVAPKKASRVQQAESQALWLITRKRVPRWTFVVDKVCVMISVTMATQP